MPPSPPDMRLAAITGGTGFLGRYIVAALHRAGFRVRMLVRQDPVHPLLAECRPELVLGDLRDAQALARLVEGADCVIHAAGLIKAVDRVTFFAVNEGGSAALGQAVAAHAPGARLLVLSSLAASQPHLSHYAASKRAGEEAAIAGFARGDWVVVRPPAIYGPWDRETLSLFKAAAGPLVPVMGGPQARIAMIHAADAAGAVAALAMPGGPRARIFALCDGVAGGYDWSTLLDCAADAVGRRALRVRMPLVLLRAAGLGGSLRAALTGRATMLTWAKSREISFPDWSVASQELPPDTLWQPRISLSAGFMETARWYREQRWL
ncbi:NAD-dependent epimerase/dehydratase family protein [Niveispirillum fermenti]|uniref:NAD-dependent epimerase/dehydratase family protein n=1 Tax=Niveispirillum fermenti TaxID=1233113 RepID=UPI003A866397